MTRPDLKAVDFFCGAGGMSYGLKSSGIHVIAGVDVDVTCRATYEYNVKGSQFLHCDVMQLAPAALMDRCNLRCWDDNLLLTGCSPCQFWSKINTDKRKSKQSAFLLQEFARFIEKLMPGWILIENVPGIVNKRGSALPAFSKLLTQWGYEFAHSVLDLSKYQIPQTRHRFVLIANRLGIKGSLPTPSPATPVTVRQRLGPSNGFAPIAAGHKDESPFMHTASVLSPVNLTRIRKTPQDGGQRSAWKDDAELQVAAYQGRESEFSDVYSRMFWDKPAPTITTRFNSFSNGRFGHPSEDRGISLREGATLQTFPKRFRFFGSIASIAKQIGNAVPPSLAKQLGKHILSEHLKIAGCEHSRKIHI